MGLAFFETMAGSVGDAQGAYPLDFDVKAEAASLRRLFRTGESRLTGVLRAPFVGDCAVEGTLTMSPRRLSYRLVFEDEEGVPCRLEGTKFLAVDGIRKRMTTLHTSVWHGQRRLDGLLYFDLRDLPDFLRSATPFPGMERVDLVAPLGAGERAALAAWARAAIVPGELVPAPDQATIERAVTVVETFPPMIRAATRWALRTLDTVARLRHGRRFAALAPAEAGSLAAMLAAAGPAGQGLVLVLGLGPKTAHFARRDYLDAVGVPRWDEPVREPEPRWMQQVTSADELPREAELEADVVVVGTGAGGGPVAAVLAEAGLAVALLEEGPYAGRREFRGPAEDRMASFYHQGGLQLALGSVPVALPTGRLVGGSTAINSGTCFRTPDAVLQRWRADGLPADFSPQSFGRWLDPVWRELRVEPGEAPYLGKIASVVARGAGAMGKEHGPLARNAEGCDGQGVCPLGCPTEAKRSTNVSYVPRALKAGAECFTGLRVTRVLRHGRQAVGVEARGTSVDGAPRRLRVRARAVVVAAGTLQSPLLLHRSGVSLPMLGKNLSIHPALGMFALFSERMEAWKAIPQSYGVEDLLPGTRFEGFYVPPQLAAPLMPLEGAELTRWMDRAAEVGQFGFMVRDVGAGSVRPGPGGQPLIRYELSRSVLDRMGAGSALLAELLLRGGAEEVLAGVGGVASVRTVDEARALRRFRRPTDFRAIGFHPLGTCRMGRDARVGVVDGDHRVYGTDNLYVVDGSSVPTSLGVNPQVTIMAMATRAAERMVARL